CRRVCPPPSNAANSGRRASGPPPSPTPPCGRREWRAGRFHPGLQSERASRMDLSGFCEENKTDGKKIILQDSFFQFLIICMIDMPKSSSEGGASRRPGLPESLLESADSKQGVSQKMFAILEAVAGAGRPLTVSELVVLLDVPKPTMHRI